LAKKYRQKNVVVVGITNEQDGEVREKTLFHSWTTLYEKEELIITVSLSLF
jgi:hypothetical protein